MKEYLFVFRTDYDNMPMGTPEERQAMTKRWMDWIGSIAAQDKLADRGRRLDNTGKVIRHDHTVSNGPFADIKESIGGYTLVKADSYEAALEMAKGCPILSQGGMVEVREISPL